MKFSRVTAVLLVVVTVGAGLSGCGSGDTDPNAKIDAPGYYNGPLKGKGAGGSENPTEKIKPSTADE